MHFTKMQGCGNDYVYVDCFTQAEPANPSELSKRISNRHYGIGSDGLILILPSKIADARMRMWNADGSEGVMCGNGIRCVAKYVHDHLISRKSAINIETGRGVLTIQINSTNERESVATVDMGEPILDAKSIPTTFESSPVVNQHPPYWEAGRYISDFLLDQGNFSGLMTCLSLGNPHAVLFGDDVAKIKLDQVGPILEHAPVFPDRANVHFVTVLNRNEVTMRTWERGSGATMACGTGACAACVAGFLTNRTERKILAHMPGGDLRLHWSENDNHVYMTGPAVEVFSGDWPDA